MSDVRKGAASAAVIWFLNRISEQHWSVGFSFVITLLLLGIAWWWLRSYMPQRMAKASQKTGKQRGRLVRDQHSLIGLTVIVLALVAAIFAGWNGVERSRVQRLERGLSWRAREFWRAQCLGMKIVQISGMTAKNIQQYMPTMSQLPYDAMMGERRQAIYELQGEGIIRNDIPPDKVPSGVIVQTTETTPLGRMLCTYYLTAYSTPKLPEAPNKAK